jgi:hypothetical protein
MRWKCEKHKTYCYIANDVFNNPHVQMDPRMWDIWASKIENGIAVYDYPPRTKEFNDAVDKASNSQRGRGVSKAAIQSSEFSDDLPRAIQLYTVAPPSQSTPPPHFPFDTRRYNDPVSPSKKLIKKPRRNVIQLLRERGYGPKDFNGRGLKEFLTWYQCKDPEEDFDVICEQLQEEKLGVDLLGDIDPSILMSCGIEQGTAIRILEGFNEWLEPPTSTTSNQLIF